MIQFNNIVGNPPYHQPVPGRGSNDKKLYQTFTTTAIRLKPDVFSLIIPLRWYTDPDTRHGNSFKEQMMKNRHIQRIHAYPGVSTVFPGVEINGGVMILMVNNHHDGGGAEYYMHLDDGRIIYQHRRFLDEFRYIPCDPRHVPILRKVAHHQSILDAFKTISRDTFGIGTNLKVENGRGTRRLEVADRRDDAHPVLIHYRTTRGRQKGYLAMSDIPRGRSVVGKWKVLMPQAAGHGLNLRVLGKPILAGPGEICSETYRCVCFEERVEAVNFIRYLGSRFCRVCAAAVKNTQQVAMKVYSYVPMQDFSCDGRVRWDCGVGELDRQLYDFYGFSVFDVCFVEERVGCFYGLDDVI